jgi:hypothetical protein
MSELTPPTAMTGVCMRSPRIHNSEFCLIYNAVLSVQKTLQGKCNFGSLVFVSNSLA